MEDLLLFFFFYHIVDNLAKRDDCFLKKNSSYFNSACKSSSKLCSLVPREVMVCYIFHASVTSSTLFLILFSTYALQDAIRVEDAFTLGAWVPSMAIAKGSTRNGIGMKVSSNSLIHSFSLKFSVSMPPMES
jgi:hypothetical protein